MTQVVEYSDGSCCCGSGSAADCCPYLYPLPNFLPNTVPFCVSETIQPGTPFETTMTWGGTATLALLAPDSGTVNWYHYAATVPVITGPGAPAPGEGFTTNTISGFIGCVTASIDGEGHYVPPKMFFTGIINHDTVSLHVEDRFNSTAITPTLNEFVCDPFCYDAEGDFTHDSVGLLYDFHMRVTAGTCATWCPAETGTGTGTACPCAPTVSLCVSVDSGDPAYIGKYALTATTPCVWEGVSSCDPTKGAYLTLDDASGGNRNLFFGPAGSASASPVAEYRHFGPPGSFACGDFNGFIKQFGSIDWPSGVFVGPAGLCPDVTCPTPICDCSVTGSMIATIVGGPPGAAGTYTLPPAGIGFPCVWTLSVETYTITLFKSGVNWILELDGSHGQIVQWQSTDLCASWTIIVDDFGTGGSLTVSRA